MKCLKCGYNNEKDAKFCKKCGTKLRDISYHNPKKNNNHSKTLFGKKKPLIILFIVLIVGIIAYIGYVSYMNENYDQAYKMSYYYQKHWDGSWNGYNQSVTAADDVIKYRKEMVQYATSDFQKEYAKAALKYAQNLKEIRDLKAQEKALENSEDYQNQSGQEQDDYTNLAYSLNATYDIYGSININDSEMEPYKSTLESKYPLVAEDDNLNSQINKLESNQTELSNEINLIFVQNPDFKSHINVLMDEVNY